MSRVGSHPSGKSSHVSTVKARHLVNPCMLPKTARFVGESSWSCCSHSLLNHSSPCSHLNPALSGYMKTLASSTNHIIGTIQTFWGKKDCSNGPHIIGNRMRYLRPKYITEWGELHTLKGVLHYTGRTIIIVQGFAKLEEPSHNSTSVCYIGSTTK